MEGNAYQLLAARTINMNLTPLGQRQHALYGMVSEFGEIFGLYQKVYQGHELDNEHLKKEVGDLLWFIAEFCTSNGWELDDIFEINIEKLKARYPEGFEAERSLNREEGDV